MIDTFKSFTYIEYIDSDTIKAVIPSGFYTGIYNLHVTNSDGGHTILRNAFTVYGEIIPDMCLSTGLNFFGYPIESVPGYTSYSVIKALGIKDEICRIKRYDPNTRTYRTTIYDPNGILCGDDFDIVSGKGCLVYMKKAKAVLFDGSITNPGITLTEGLNILSFPGITSGFTLYDLHLYLGTSEEISSIQGFNTEKGGFETTNNCFGRPSGTKFYIIKGEAYLIHIKVDKYKDPPY